MFAAAGSVPGAPAAKDEWLQVRSKNFNLIGNANERDIRKVATKLEQFRETFRLVFKGLKLNSPIPTNVVVFKNASAYNPFKPVRADGKADKFIAGYFQPGEDVNYITLATEGADEDVYGTIFHEYVHFMLDTSFGKSDVPPWFNEGLAEYYQTFEIEADQKVKLGLPQGNHLALLQQNSLIPLETLFMIDNYSLHQNGNHSRSVFYAQSWALIHYLIQSGKSDGLANFLRFLSANIPAEKAFRDAFQTDYKEMEKDLKNYVQKNTYRYTLITFDNKLTFDGSMAVSPLSDADSSAYLGDLLYHTNRENDAEPFLQKALTMNADSVMANTTYGMVKIKQKKYADAKKYLEKAVAADQKNPLSLYRYAYLLSREDLDENNFVQSFPAEKAAKMRDLLKKAIALNPAFTESHELLAFVNLVQNEELDEAVDYLKKALVYQPGNQRYAVRIAEIYARQEKLTEASAIADKVAQTADEPQTRAQAENLKTRIRQQQEYAARRRQYDSSSAANNGVSGPPVLLRSSNSKPPSPEDIAKAREIAELRSINQMLKKAASGNKQIVGRIQKIECKPKSIVYTVKTGSETMTLSSADFQKLELTSYTNDANNAHIGCDAKVESVNAVLTYKPSAAAAGAKNAIGGELQAVDFVPANFRLMNEDEMNEDSEVIYSGGDEDVPSAPDSEGTMSEQQEAAILRGLKSSLRQPMSNETRSLGKIEKVECGDKGILFYLTAANKTYKLFAASPQSIQITAFTPDASKIAFGCGMKNVDIPVVFTFAAGIDLKSNADGSLVSLEFVPEKFTLDGEK